MNPTAVAIAKEAESRKQEIESLRNIPKDLMDQVKQAGLVKQWAATQFGGAQASVKTVCDTIQSMAYHNGSLAWVTSVTGCSALFSGFLPGEKSSQLFKDPMAMVGGFAGPAGIAQITKDGLLVSGRWSWGSGITHCSHIVGGVKIMEGENFKGIGVVFFRPKQLTFHDNWHVSGLKGTHSIDYSCENVKITNDCWSVFPVAKPTIDEPLYRFSFLGALSLSVASVGIGLAKRAVDEIIILSKVKSPFGQGKSLSRRESAQEKIGKIIGDYESAKAMFDNTIDRTQAEADRGLCSMESKAKVRLAASQAIRLCESAVNTAHRLAGGSAIWESHKLEEIMRDMHVVTQHGMVNEGNFRTAAAALLGGAVPESML